MIAVVIYGIIAIALAAVAGYSIISFFDASRTMSRASENISRMDMAVNLVKANIRYVDGYPLVPMGRDGDDYTVLPTWMGAHDTSTSGDKYIYCPFASDNRYSSSSGSVTDGDGTTYDVKTKSNSQTGNNAYVYGFDDSFFTDSGLQDSGILAFVLSPLENNSTMPVCKDVELTTSGNYVVDNGVVKVVQLGTISAQRNLLASAKAVFYVDDVVAGDASGRDSNNPSTIDEALAFMAVYAPRVMEIRLDDGDYTISVDAFADNAKAMGESKLLLIGDGGDEDDIFISTPEDEGYPPISLPVNIHLKDVGITTDLIVHAGRSLYVDGDVKIESIISKGGDIYLDNEDVDLEITGTNDIDPSGVSSGIYLFHGSRLISVAGSGSGNKLYFTGNASGDVSGIYSQGEVDLVYTDLEFSNTVDAGIYMSDGSVLNMSNVLLASTNAEPDVGVFDDGNAMSVSGDNTEVHGTACWGGSGDSLFEYSSTTLNDTAVPVGQTYPVDVDVEADMLDYIEAQAVQYNNRADWTCK